jgi:hypothetical protein
MKIIQSCWSCNRPNLHDFGAGWFAPEYNLMSWALSCLQLNKYYDNLILYADSVSARTLIDELKLPYSTIRCELDELNKFDPMLWALPKIYAYSKQLEPFLHVDADVFIWEPFDKTLLSSGLIAQNLELVNDYYENIIRSLDGKLKFFPAGVINERRANTKFYAYNAGILGGSDIAFFREYATKAFNFVFKNIKYFDKIKVNDFNVVFEQYLFYCMVKEKNKKVEVLIPEILNDYVGFAEFNEVPHNKQFLHLLGQYKAHKPSYEQMADRLRLDYPEYYYRIIALFKNKQLPLKRTYYSLLDNPTENELIASYHLLRERFLNNNLNIVSENCPVRTFEHNGFRIRFVKNAVEARIAESDKVIENYQAHLNDIETFENDINDVLIKKFYTYSSEYLYARDITFTAYFSIVFGDKLSGRDINIITDSTYEIIESQYDWSEVDFSEFGRTVLMEQLDLSPTLNFTALIPECDSIGYSLINIDELDLSILELCKKPSTINKILKELESSFDLADLEESREEFEELISGRIKIALSRKLIKVVKN